MFYPLFGSTVIFFVCCIIAHRAAPCVNGVSFANIMMKKKMGGRQAVELNCEKSTELIPFRALLAYHIPNL